MVAYAAYHVVEPEEGTPTVWIDRIDVKDGMLDGIGDPVAFLLEADLDGDGALSMEELPPDADTCESTRYVVVAERR